MKHRGLLAAGLGGLAVVAAVLLVLRLLDGGPGVEAARDAGDLAASVGNGPEQGSGAPARAVGPLPVSDEAAFQASGAALPHDVRPLAERSAAERLEASGVLLVVRVLDGDSRPITAAELLLSAAGAAPQRGRSDAEGVLSLPLATLASVQLVVRREGFAPVHVGSELIAEHVAAGRRLEVVLRRMDRLYGKVALSGPIAVPAGVVVVASRGAEPPTREALLAALAAEAEPLPDQATLLAEVAAGTSPDLMLTRTLQGGRFAFPRPVPDGRWQLEAGGLGLATNGSHMLIMPLGEAVVLRGHSAHAVAVQLRDVHGNALAGLPGQLELGSGMRPGDNWYSCDFTPVVRLLLGIEWRPEWGSGQLVEAAAPQWEDEVGPLRVKLGAPGYDTLPLELMLPNVRYGLREERVTLLAAEGRFGDLELHLPGWTAGIGSSKRAPYITLELKSKSGERLQRPVRDLVDDRLVLSRLPHGEYTASLDITCYLGTSHAPQSVTIADERATLEFPLTELATLELAFVTPEQKAYAGQVAVILGFELETGELAGDMAAFDAPPYRMPFLKPGAFLVRVEMAKPGDGQVFRSRAHPVELLAGKTTRANVQLEPRS